MRLLGDRVVSANGARLVRSWCGVHARRPVVWVVHDHPWWGSRTGLRRLVDEPVPTMPADGQTPEMVAEWMVSFDIGEPLGTVANDLVPDADEVWWWGDEPLPGDHRRRGRP